MRGQVGKTPPRASEGKMPLRRTPGISRRAEPCFSPPWDALGETETKCFIGRLRNISRELLFNICSQAVLFVTFLCVLYLITFYPHVLSCRQSLSPAIQKTYISVAQIKLQCLSTQLSKFLTERDRTLECGHVSS